MVKYEAVKKLGCLYCGAPFEAYPPDDFHIIASLKSEGANNPVKMVYKCQAKGCGSENIIYWCSPKGKVYSGSVF